MQVILRRARSMSAQLQILVLDKATHAVRNTIHAMVFEGVSKDDVNYSLAIHYKEQGPNELLLFYPNGIIVIYDNIIQQVQNRKKVQLRRIIQSEYDHLTAPQIIGDRLIAVSQPSFRNREVTQGHLLLSFKMDKFEQEVVQKRSSSSEDVSVVRISELIQKHESLKGVVKLEPSVTRLTDLCCTSIPAHSSSIHCFFAFNNGHVMHHSFESSRTRVFSLYESFSGIDVFEQAVNEADLELPEVFASNQIKSASSKERMYAQQLCKVTCLDFLAFSPEQDRILGLLLLGDQLGFVYLIMMSASAHTSDKLLYMNNTNQQPNSEAKPLIAASWLSWNDKKFAIITANGDLIINEVALDEKEELCDQVIVNKIHQIQTFEELPNSFAFCQIYQTGSQAIQTHPDADSRPGILPDFISILWPGRVLRKHDISSSQRKEGQFQSQASKDKIITQSTLHHYSVIAANNPLKVLGSVGSEGSRSLMSNVVLCSPMSSNGACFMQQMSQEKLVPTQQNQTLACPEDYEMIFYIDEAKLSLCAFSTVSGEQRKIVDIGDFLGAQSNESNRLVFTDLQMR